MKIDVSPLTIDTMALALQLQVAAAQNALAELQTAAKLAQLAETAVKSNSQSESLMQ